MNTNVQKETSSNESCWNETLKCYWNSWRVINECHLVLDLPYQNAPDMNGTIKIAEMLSMNVDRVDVYSGGILNVLYRFNHHNEKWAAFVPTKNENKKLMAFVPTKSKK